VNGVDEKFHQKAKLKKKKKSEFIFGVFNGQKSGKKKGKSAD